MLPIGDMTCRHFFAILSVYAGTIWLEISARRAEQGLGATAGRGAAPNRLVHSPPPPAAVFGLGVRFPVKWLLTCWDSLIYTSVCCVRACVCVVLLTG